MTERELIWIMAALILLQQIALQVAWWTTDQYRRLVDSAHGLLREMLGVLEEPVDPTRGEGGFSGSPVRTAGTPAGVLPGHKVAGSSGPPRRTPDE